MRLPRTSPPLTWLLTVAVGACADTEHDAPDAGSPRGVVAVPPDTGVPMLDAGGIIVPPSGVVPRPPDAGPFVGTPPIPPDAGLHDAGPATDGGATTDGGAHDDAGAQDAGCVANPLAPLLGLIIGDGGAAKCPPSDGGP